MTDQTLTQLTAAVARARAAEAGLAGRVKALKEEQAAALAPHLAELKAAQLAVEQAETEAKARAVAEWNATPAEARTKKLLEGVGIQEREVFTYDQEKAFAWAQEKKLALIPESLDVKAFESFVKTSPATFPFVTRTMEPVATLAKDLSRYLDATPKTPETPF